MTAPLSIEQFKVRFFQEKSPYWFAYHNTSRAESAGKFRDDDETLTPEEKLEYSWMQFEELVNSIDWGKIKVICKTNEKNNQKNAPTYHVEWGNIPSPGSRYAAGNSQQNNMNGFGGGGWPMMQYFMDQQRRMQDDLTNSRMEALRLTMENRYLADQLEADQAPDIKEKLLMEGVGALKTIISANAVRQPAQLGTMGQRNAAGHQPPSPPPTGSQSEGEEPFSLDEAFAYMKAITDLFPEYPRVTVLKAFYNLALQNKDFIGAQLAAVINADTEHA